LAGQKSKRRSRKRRNPTGSAPRAVSSLRRDQRAERMTAAAREQRAAKRTLGTQGERPPSPFGGVPVSEIAIFAGLVAIVVWLFTAATPSLIVGLAACALGVIEFTAREHLSGFRSHATLLAGIPAVAIGIGIVSAIGSGRDRAPLLIVTAGPVFGILFWLLRKRFQTARQARIARPPTP
jgi:hypothetical protein